MNGTLDLKMGDPKLISIATGREREGLRSFELLRPPLWEGVPLRTVLGAVRILTETAGLHSIIVEWPAFCCPPACTWIPSWLRIWASSGRQKEAPG